MKKVLLAIAVLSISASLYAGSFIGVSVAPDWYFDSKGSGCTDILFTADGANYFGLDHSFGIEYGIGVVFPINMWEEERTESLAGSPYGFVFRAGLGYRYDTGNLIGIFLGAGVRGTLQMFNDEPSPDQDLRVFMLDIYGRAGIDFNIMDILSINAGLLAGGSVYTGATVLPGGVSSDGYAGNGFFIAPFAGISLTY